MPWAYEQMNFMILESREKLNETHRLDLDIPRVPSKVFQEAIFPQVTR